MTREEAEREATRRNLEAGERGREAVPLERMARLGFAARPPQTSQRDLILNAAVVTVLPAVFPRVAYRLRWWLRAGWPGFLVAVVSRTLFTLAVDGLVRSFARTAIEHETFRAGLRERLGHEPSEEAVREAWLEAHGCDPSGSCRARP